MARGKGEGSIAQDARTGLWVGRIELPSHEDDDNGNPIRRRKVIRRKDKNELIREMKKLHKRLEESGDMPTSSQTVESWMTYWLREIAPKRRRPSTMNSYRSTVHSNIVPALGRLRLERVTPSDVRGMLARMEKAGSAPTTLRNTFSVLSAALADAERDGRIARNPCDLVEAPRKKAVELEVLTRAEAKRILDALEGTPDKYLWATFILTGARRGEVIGLEWDRVGRTEIDMSWQLQRILWSHGCGPRPKKGEPGACGYRRAASCPSKRLDIPHDYEYRHISGGLYWTRPKSSAGWRVIPLVEPLRGWLQDWRSAAPSNTHGLVFATESGGPIDPDDASKVWKEVRASLGVSRRVRLHDLRHGAIDAMYRERVPEADIIRIFGHSTVQMSRSYRSLGDRGREAEAMERMSAGLGYLAIE